MRNPSLRSKVVALVLAMALVGPWYAAAAPTSEPPDFLSRLWLFITSLWSEPPATSNGDSGCHIDPHGRCGG